MKIMVQDSNDHAELLLMDLIMLNEDNFNSYDCDNSDDDSEFEDEIDGNDSESNSAESEYQEDSSKSISPSSKVSDFGVSFAKNLKGYFDRPSSTQNVESLSSKSTKNELIEKPPKTQSKLPQENLVKKSHDEKIHAPHCPLQKVIKHFDILSESFPSKFTSNEHANQFLNKIFDEVINVKESSRLYVEFAFEVIISMPDEMRRHVMENLHALLEEKLSSLMKLHYEGCSKELIVDRANVIGMLIGNLYIFDFISSDVIYPWICGTSHEEFYFMKTMRHWILVTAKDKIFEEAMMDYTNDDVELLQICIVVLEEGYMQGPGIVRSKNGVMLDDFLEYMDEFRFKFGNFKKFVQSREKNKEKLYEIVTKKRSDKKLAADLISIDDTQKPKEGKKIMMIIFH